MKRLKHLASHSGPDHSQPLSLTVPLIFYTPGRNRGQSVGLLYHSRVPHPNRGSADEPLAFTANFLKTVTGRMRR